METKFNFNSQVCTNRQQSERLLALGLKKETADMCWTQEEDGWGELQWYCRVGTYTQKDAEIGFFDYIPAWSLHRLLSMLPDDAPKIYWILDSANITIYFEDDCGTFFPHKGDIYEGVVNCIEWLIKEGYFNKEYLV